MESFNPFSNSISRTPSKSIPLPAISPLHSILPSKPVSILSSSENSTLLCRKQKHSLLGKPHTPLWERLHALRPALTTTLSSEYKKDLPASANWCELNRALFTYLSNTGPACSSVCYQYCLINKLPCLLPIVPGPMCSGMHYQCVNRKKPDTAKRKID